MESKRADAEHVIPRYLAGRLPANESDAFERSLSERQELRDETEDLLKLREGLARLRERGEIEALLRSAGPRRWVPYAAAAALAVVCLAALLWSYLPRPAPALLALSPAALAANQHQPAPVLGTYVLARMRGTTAITDVKRVGVIELRVLPAVMSPAVGYRARVSRLDGPTAGKIAGQIDAGPARPDGYVTLYLDALQLTPGDYEVSLSPLGAAEANAAGDQFVIRVR